MRGILLAVTIGLFSACAPTEPALPSTAEVRAAIEESNAAFAEAFNNKDLDAVVGFYTADAVALPPNQGAQEGQDAIRQALSADSEIVSELTLTTVDVEVLSDSAAVERGTYTVQVTIPDQEEPIEDRGKYVVFWKKGDDGAWRLHWDIWNSDVPPPTPEEPEAAG